MKLIKSFVVIERPRPFNPQDIFDSIEEAARICYKSEEHLGENQSSLISKLVNAKPVPHEAMLEFARIRVRFVTNRGISHEIVRRRIGVSIAQESTRYCNYGKKGEGVTFILPVTFGEHPRWDNMWVKQMESSEAAYLEALGLGIKPEFARDILPHSLKTEVLLDMNITGWRDWLNKRCNLRAHPSLRMMTIPLLRTFKEELPGLFDDIPFNEDFMKYAKVFFMPPGKCLRPSTEEECLQMNFTQGF